MTDTFPAKFVSEKVTLTFDFEDALGTRTIATVGGVTPTVVRGTDASPAAILNGSATPFGGTKVLQPVRDGVADTDYLLRCSIAASDGAVLELDAILPVLAAPALIPTAPAQRWQDAANRYTLVNTIAPAVEPVTLAEAKLHLREDGDENDALISELITAARESAENICRRAFVTSTWLYSIDRFNPSYGGLGMPYGSGGAWAGDFGYLGAAPPIFSSPSTYMRVGGEIELPLPDVQSVLSIVYLDTNGAQQTIVPTGYEVDITGYPATIVPAYGTAWPNIRPGRYGVQIAFVAGFGGANAVPASIKAWIKLMIGTMYENRESLAMFRGTIQDLGFADRLLDRYRIMGF